MGWSLWSFISSDIAMDLGTANTLIYVKRRGILLNEPSVIAVRKEDFQVLAVGREARGMWGKTPEEIMTVRPMKDGVIADFDLAEMMIKKFIRKVQVKHFFHPIMTISIPSGITEVERRAVRDSGEHAGGREVYLIEEPMAAAIGVDLPVEDPVGSMVVDIGGGTTEIAVVAMSGIVTKISIRIAGDEMNDAIVQYFKKKYNLLLGEMMAEQIKIDSGSTRPFKDLSKVPVRGRDLITGIPRNMEVAADEIQDALEEPVRAIVEAVLLALEKTPPELSSDILERGIIMTGGGSLLKGLDARLRKETNIPVNLAEDPLTAVVRGVGKVLEDLDRYKRILNLKARR
ncbi:MAG TPA: rod shape-determining protein [bacterium]|nr:rod shape-determining protein [bacterium]